LLAAVAVRRSRDWRIVVLASLAILGLVLALGDGTWLFRILQASIPGMGFIRYPIKYIVLVLAVVPILAAFGLRSLACGKEGPGRFECVCAALLLVLLGVILIWDWRTSDADDLRRATLQNGLVRGVAFVAIFLAGASFIR